MLIIHKENICEISFRILHDYENIPTTFLPIEKQTKHVLQPTQRRESGKMLNQSVTGRRESWMVVQP